MHGQDQDPGCRLPATGYRLPAQDGLDCFGSITPRHVQIDHCLQRLDRPDAQMRADLIGHRGRITTGAEQKTVDQMGDAAIQRRPRRPGLPRPASGPTAADARRWRTRPQQQCGRVAAKTPREITPSSHSRVRSSATAMAAGSTRKAMRWPARSHRPPAPVARSPRPTMRTPPPSAAAGGLSGRLPATGQRGPRHRPPGAAAAAEQRREQCGQHRPGHRPAQRIVQVLQRSCPERPRQERCGQRGHGSPGGRDRPRSAPHRVSRYCHSAAVSAKVGRLLSTNAPELLAALTSISPPIATKPMAVGRPLSAAWVGGGA
jgi:hypothetical protein